jgi:hemoglobin-like flavoprotein
MMAPTNPIQHSFELAATRCEDLTPPVYRRLFREHPEAEAMFRSQASELVKGSRRNHSRSRKFDPMSAFFLIGS